MTERLHFTSQDIKKDYTLRGRGLHSRQKGVDTETQHFVGRTLENPRQTWRFPKFLQLKLLSFYLLRQKVVLEFHPRLSQAFLS